MVVLDEQIGTAMEITSISWMYISLLPEAACENFTMHLGYCPDDTLDLDFESNYAPGSKTLVFSANPLQITAPGSGEWVTIALDEPFWYNGADNLIIDCQWNNAGDDNSFYAAQWASGKNSCVYEYSTPQYSHTRSTEVPYMILTGTLGLESETFASVKILLGR